MLRELKDIARRPLVSEGIAAHEIKGFTAHICVYSDNERRGFTGKSKGQRHRSREAKRTKPKLEPPFNSRRLLGRT